MKHKASRETPSAGQVAHALGVKTSEDVTFFSATVKNLDGPHGLNFLQMSHSEPPADNTLDLTRSSVLARVKNFSSIDLTGTINNTIKLNWAAVTILSDTWAESASGQGSGRMLVVSGNVGDVVQLVKLDSWLVTDPQSAEVLSATYGRAHQFLPGHAYKAYTLHGATVFVDAVMAVSDAPAQVDAPLKSQAFSIEQLFGASALAAVAEPESDDATQPPADEGVARSFKGVAIVFAGTGGANGDLATTGHYELSKDGGATWMAVAGDLNDAKAVYADKSALLRYVGAEEAERTQPQSLMVRLMDDSGLNGSGSYGPQATGSTIDVSVHGLSAAFSADALTLLSRSSLSQPLLPTMPTAADPEQDDGVPLGVVGSPVSSLVGGAEGLADKGIAITGVDVSQGTLFYSTNGGGTWTEVNRPLSESQSLFMRSDGDNRVYFKPNADGVMHSGNALTIRAWDQSEATETIFFKTTDDGLTIPEAGASGEPLDVMADVSSVPETLAEAQDRGAGIEVTPQDLAAAIAASVNASMAKVYAMPLTDRLDLDALLSQSSNEAGLSAPGGLDSPPHVVHLTMADVLSLPAHNGVHQLVVSGTANDTLMLSKDEWTDTGTVVNQDGHSYAVYAGSSDASAQLLIDQHMLQNLTSS